jgi:hypothetical protein
MIQVMVDLEHPPTCELGDIHCELGDVHCEFGDIHCEFGDDSGDDGPGALL